MSQHFPPRVERHLPLTVAEKSGFTSTSRHADVLHFIAQVQEHDADMRVETFGLSAEGRELPLVVMGPKGAVDPHSAHSADVPVVFIMANIHAGEVEGKEASLMLIRELAGKHLRRLRDKMLLLIAPIYNADGNERIAVDNRPTQNGPVHGCGTRENAAGLDLNRDFMKLESPEARALVSAVLSRWDPLVTIDLHTTNGSYHGYQLTYAPSLNPNSPPELTSFARGTLLPSIRQRMKKDYGKETYYYGNFQDQLRPELGWYTFDSRPRFGTNYGGLRNRFTILSEAYSYIDYKARCEVTWEFLLSSLETIREEAKKMAKIAAAADAEAMHGRLRDLGVRFAIKPFDENVEILWERTVDAPELNGDPDPETGKGSMHRTGEIVPVKMTDYGIFEPTERAPVPYAYLFDAALEGVAANLQAHGIVVERLRTDFEAEAEEFVAGEARRATAPFQGHLEVEAHGKWSKGKMHALPAGTFVVRLDQRLGRLAFTLLDPRSDDGLVNWNYFDALLETPGSVLLRRCIGETPMPLVVV